MLCPYVWVRNRSARRVERIDHRRPDRAAIVGGGEQPRGPDDGDEQERQECAMAAGKGPDGKCVERQQRNTGQEPRGCGKQSGDNETCQGGEKRI
jgi:hypothetical protein